MSGGHLRAVGLTRVFGSGSREVHACTNVSLEAEPGELLVVRGPSGSGKTTLLNMLGGLDTPTSGSVHLDGDELSAMSEDELVEVRRHRIGFVFQSFGLLSVLSAAENVEVPLRLARTDPDERDRRVRDLLEQVGLADHTEQRPHELSGGQQQRVAIARALACEPDVLIADEPTGQLDSQTGGSVLQLIRGLVRDRGLTALVATHDPLVTEEADRVLTLRDGRLVDAMR
jgi:putative ABC transport system ATP-binding protein